MCQQPKLKPFECNKSQAVPPESSALQQAYSMLCSFKKCHHRPLFLRRKQPSRSLQFSSLHDHDLRFFSCLNWISLNCKMPGFSRMGPRPTQQGLSWQVPRTPYLFFSVGIPQIQNLYVCGPETKAELQKRLRESLKSRFTNVEER